MKLCHDPSVSEANPLYHYKENSNNNDVKCALCCGLHKQKDSYNCCFCPFTFCVECYKHLCLTSGTPQQFISNKAKWKCFVCSCSENEKKERNVFIKEQLEKMIPFIEGKIKEGCVIGKSEEELSEFVETMDLN